MKLDVNGRIAPTFGTATDAAYRFGWGVENTGFSSPSSNSIAIITSGSERVRINAAGYVGIGTNSPEYPLHVETVSSRAIYGMSSATNAVGVYGFGSATGGVKNFGVLGQTNSTGGYAGYFLGGRNYFQGDVGIGTLNPDTKLHLSDSGDAPELRFTGSSVMEDNEIWASISVYKGTNAFLGRTYWKGDTAGRPDWTLDTRDVPGALVVDGATGHVGIGTESPGLFTLAVNGAAAKPSGGSWSVFSDRRLKKNIKPLVSTLKRLLSLRGVAFEYKQPDQRFGLPGRQIGMIAQDVEQFFPEWVDQDAEGYRFVTFRGFEALTVEALRELREEKDMQLRERDLQIERLDGKIMALEGRLARLESLLATDMGDTQ